MTYVAQKPCRLAGQSFLIGDTVPAEVIQPGAVKNLVAMGILSVIENEVKAEENPSAQTAEEETVTILVHADEGELECTVTREGLQKVFDVLQSTVSEAEEIIPTITEPDALILIDVCDQRKSIKAAVKEYGLQISEEA